MDDLLHTLRLSSVSLQNILDLGTEGSIRLTEQLLLLNWVAETRPTNRAMIVDVFILAASEDCRERVDLKAAR